MPRTGSDTYCIGALRQGPLTSLNIGGTVQTELELEYCGLLGNMIVNYIYVIIRGKAEYVFKAVPPILPVVQ
jgi:hypothetical protein